MRKIIIAYLILFTISFVYFSIHTLVGLDEVMLLDPCINWLHGNGYASKLWFAPGTENHYMAYLPATSVFRIFFLLLLPDKLFFHRLPFILAFFTCAFLLFKIARNKTQNSRIAFLSLLFFLSDKGLWDTTLSGRSEILQVLLILVYFFLELKVTTNTYAIMKGLVAGVLFLTHPPAWIIVLALLVLQYRKNNLKDFVLSIIAFFIPVFLFLLTVNFNFKEILIQLFNDGSTVAEKHNSIYRLSHFYQRFLPYPYKFQPWVIVLFLASVFFILNLRIFKEKFVLKIGYVFFMYLLFIAVASENYYRYNAPLLVCMYLLLPFILQYISGRTGLLEKFPILILTIIVVSVPLLFRLFNVINNKSSNNTELVVKQIDASMITPGYSLIIGEPVGYYCALQSPFIDYSTIYTSAKYSFNKYEYIYLLTYENLPLSNYTLINVLVPEPLQDGTYKGLKLYLMKEKEIQWSVISGRESVVRKLTE